MVELYKVKAHATTRGAANALTKWTDRAGNNAADEAANAQSTLSQMRQTLGSNAWTRWSGGPRSGWASARRCATKRATRKRQSRLLVNERATNLHLLLGRSRKWQRVTIFLGGTVLMVSGAVLGVVQRHSSARLFSTVDNQAASQRSASDKLSNPTSTPVGFKECIRRKAGLQPPILMKTT